MTPQAGGRPAIRFMPVEFGYGPLGKALHIARAVRERAGDAVWLELVASPTFRSPVNDQLFDACVGDLAGSAPADATVTVMNVKGIRDVAKSERNIYVVDSLAWLWDVPLPIQDLVHTYFYQALPLLPVPSRNLSGMPRPTPVGAIGRLPDVAPGSGRPKRVVVSLSGLEAPGSRLDSGRIAYAPYILDALEELVADGRLDPDNLALFGNTAVLESFAGEHLRQAVSSGSQGEFAQAVRGAEAVVCPPGLTTLVECLSAGIVPRLLPPQNYSQIKIMRAFGEALGLPALSWESPVLGWLQDEVLPEVVAAEIVRGVIANERLAAGFLDPLRLLDLIEQDAPVPSDAEVAALLGPNDGARTIADRVVEDLFGDSAG